MTRLPLAAQTQDRIATGQRVAANLLKPGLSDEALCATLRLSCS